MKELRTCGGVDPCDEFLNRVSCVGNLGDVEADVFGHRPVAGVPWFGDRQSRRPPVFGSTGEYFDTRNPDVVPTAVADESTEDLEVEKISEPVVHAIDRSFGACVEFLGDLPTHRIACHGGWSFDPDMASDSPGT